MIYLNEKRIAVIGIDHGYGNIKTANTITPTAIMEYDTEPVFSGNILEYGGKYYRIGEGHKEFIVNKAMDEDFYMLTLVGVACELNRAGMREADVHLAAGLPLTWVRKQRESFREYLLRNAKVEYRYNGKDYRVRFVGCSVYPQGYAAVVNTFGSLKGTNLLADIGNGTMNVLYIVDRKPMEDRSWTEKLGVNQCMIQAKNAIMDNFGLKIDDSIVEQVLRTGTADIAGKYLDCIIAVAKKYTADIFAALRRYEYDPALVRLLIVGGGGCLVRHFGEYDETRVTIIDDLCATAKGYETLASSSLRRRDRQ